MVLSNGADHMAQVHSVLKEHWNIQVNNTQDNNGKPFGDAFIPIMELSMTIAAKRRQKRPV